MTIARVIQAWRKGEGLSIRLAAPIIGIDRNALFRLEHGKPVNQETLIKIWRWMLE